MLSRKLPKTLLTAPHIFPFPRLLRRCTLEGEPWSSRRSCPGTPTISTARSPTARWRLLGVRRLRRWPACFRSSATLPGERDEGGGNPSIDCHKEDISFSQLIFWNDFLTCRLFFRRFFLFFASSGVGKSLDHPMAPTLCPIFVRISFFL